MSAHDDEKNGIQTYSAKFMTAGNWTGEQMAALVEFIKGYPVFVAFTPVPLRPPDECPGGGKHAWTHDEYDFARREFQSPYIMDNKFCPKCGVPNPKFMSHDLT